MSPKPKRADKKGAKLPPGKKSTPAKGVATKKKAVPKKKKAVEGGVPVGVDKMTLSSAVADLEEDESIGSTDVLDMFKQVVDVVIAEDNSSTADQKDADAHFGPLDAAMRKALAYELFAAVDIDGSGKLDLEEFSLICSRIDEDITDEEVQNSFLACGAKTTLNEAGFSIWVEMMFGDLEDEEYVNEINGLKV